MFWYLGKKNLMFDSDCDVYLFTRIRMQHWHVNSVGTGLCETAAMVSLCAPPTITHIRRWADISHITSLMMLGISRLGYSCWRLVAGYMCEVLQYGICHRYYITAERHWRPEWVRLRYRSEYDIVHKRTYHTCIAGQHRPLRSVKNRKFRITGYKR